GLEKLRQVLLVGVGLKSKRIEDANPVRKSAVSGDITVTREIDPLPEADGVTNLERHVKVHRGDVRNKDVGPGYAFENRIRQRPARNVVLFPQVELQIATVKEKDAFGGVDHLRDVH